MTGEAGAAWARAGCASPNDARPLHPQGEGSAELCRGDAPSAPDRLPVRLNIVYLCDSIV
eukprot:scaffold8424_cov120-Isochrysis_galbana.AAC.2